MTFPESPRVVYRKNPLVEVICQLRFPTILRIGANGVAGFQDRIRREYPLYELQEPSFEFPQLPKELSTIFEQLRLPKPAGAATHRFLTKDSQRFISLSDSFLALREAKYTRWELFKAEMQKAELALRELYQPAFYSRIGLRYRDVISRRSLGLDGVKWRDLLKAHLLGELGAEDVADSVVQMHTRVVLQTTDVPGGRVTITHGLVKAPETSEDCYALDADFAVEEKEGIDGPFAILDKFNRLAGKLFRWAITETLHNAMGPEVV
ncbi:MAG: TIGR04255 family protein [Chloroflexi bacterium]|nr:TIGR04255 family protein [Chloroflexota bacterium]